jgi:molecular chaperone GrpE
MVEHKKSKKTHTETENEITPQAAPEQVETIQISSDAEVERLAQELLEWQAKAQEYLDGWQRARAEFANYKKRIEREQVQVYQNASASILKRFLDALDDLDRALQNRPQDGDGVAWAEGIDLVYRKFYSILEAEGVTRIKVEGEFFDPNLHEGISQEDNDEYESGQIIAVVKNGYWIGDKVLRPATVRVAR